MARNLIRLIVAAACTMLAACAEPGEPMRHYVIDATEQRGTIRQVSRNQLKVRGCVLGVICKAKTWDRVR